MAVGIKYFYNDNCSFGYNIRMTIPKIDACEKLNAPEHLSSDVLVGALYVHNGKDNEDKLNRMEQLAKKIGGKKATYVMALLTLPQLIEDVMKTKKYTDFLTERNQRTIN